jgi:hypothetical protein
MKIMRGVVWLATGMVWAANDPFVGKWRVDPSKSQLMDVMKVERAGGNKYIVDVGLGPEAVEVDGPAAPRAGGATLTVTAEGPNAWKIVQKKDGRIQVIANWKLSQDGNTLNDEFSLVGQDGSTSTVNYVFQKKGAESGFVGRWESASAKVDPGIELEIQPYGSGGLYFSSPGLGLALKVNFNGKDSPSAGQDAPHASTFSGRRVNQHGLELTDKAQTIQVELSTDLKTLAMSVSYPREDKPRNVLVFARE